MSENAATSIFIYDLIPILDDFSLRERAILEQLYGLNGRSPQSPERVALRYGVSRERVRQVQAKAVAIIRDAPPPEAC